MSAYDVWRNHLNLKGNQWDDFNKDVRKNGYVCALCSKRFRANYPVLLCYQCVDEHIVRYDRRPDTKYKHYVYALFDEEGTCVYIGVTKTPDSRLQQHLTDKNFNHMGLLKGFSSRAKAEECETMFIATYRPKYNKAVRMPKREMPWQWREAATVLDEKQPFPKAG